jgi:hypothetical protein
VHLYVSGHLKASCSYRRRRLSAPAGFSWWHGAVQLPRCAGTVGWRCAATALRRHISRAGEVPSSCQPALLCGCQFSGWITAALSGVALCSYRAATAHLAIWAELQWRRHAGASFCMSLALGLWLSVFVASWCRLGTLLGTLQEGWSFALSPCLLARTLAIHPPRARASRSPSGQLFTSNSSVIQAASPCARVVTVCSKGLGE